MTHPCVFRHSLWSLPETMSMLTASVAVQTLNGSPLCCPTHRVQQTQGLMCRGIKLLWPPHMPEQWMWATISSCWSTSAPVPPAWPGLARWTRLLRQIKVKKSTIASLTYHNVLLEFLFLPWCCSLLSSFFFLHMFLCVCSGSFGLWFSSCQDLLCALLSFLLLDIYFSDSESLFLFVFNLVTICRAIAFLCVLVLSHPPLTLKSQSRAHVWGVDLCGCCGFLGCSGQWGGHRDEQLHIKDVVLQFPSDLAGHLKGWTCRCCVVSVWWSIHKTHCWFMAVDVIRCPNAALQSLVRCDSSSLLPKAAQTWCAGETRELRMPTQLHSCRLIS